MPPDAITIRISAGAKTIPGMLLKTDPLPKLYKCPLSKIISPIYISSVIAPATIDGIQIETNLHLPKRKEPTNTPDVTPKRIKKTAIKAADNADT